MGGKSGLHVMSLNQNFQSFVYVLIPEAIYNIDFERINNITSTLQVFTFYVYLSY